MYDRLLKRMRELIRSRQYIMPLHAEEEMEADGLTIYDVESVFSQATLSNVIKIELRQSGNI